jgi:hypothetical protein
MSNSSNHLRKIAIKLINGNALTKEEENSITENDARTIEHYADEELQRRQRAFTTNEATQQFAHRAHPGTMPHLKYKSGGRRTKRSKRTRRHRTRRHR